jgi:hypothetical protein
LNVILDPESAGKLRRLAEQAHVGEADDLARLITDP